MSPRSSDEGSGLGDGGAPAADPEGLSTLRGIVGEQHVRPGGPEDEVAGTRPALVVEPRDGAEVASVLRWARDRGVSVAPRGGGTKLGWGSRPRSAQVVLSLLRLERVVEHAWADLTVTVQAGCRLARLSEALAAHDQRLPVDALWPDRASVGGILATGDAGLLRLRFGSLRDLVIGMTLARPDGTLTRSGGKVVKNVAGYDLPKLLTGSLGTLGVITEATFRLYPRPRGRLGLTVDVASPEGARTLLAGLAEASCVPAAVQLRARSGAAGGIDVLLEGIDASLAAQRLTLEGIRAGWQEAAPDEWSAREGLWRGASPFVTCRASVEPAETASLWRALEALPGPGLRWALVASPVGAGWVRLEGAAEGVLEGVRALRRAAQSHEGSVVVLDASPEVHARLDVWGPTGDAQPLMRRVKEQFDPTGTLNPGRFVGGL